MEKQKDFKQSLATALEKLNEIKAYCGLVEPTAKADFGETEKEECKCDCEWDIKYLNDIMNPEYKKINIWNEYQLVFIKGNRFGI